VNQSKIADGRVASSEQGGRAKSHTTVPFLKGGHDKLMPYTGAFLRRKKYVVPTAKKRKGIVRRGGEGSHKVKGQSTWGQKGIKLWKGL